MPSDRDDVHFITSMARGVCEGSPAFRCPELCTCVNRPVPQAYNGGDQVAFNTYQAPLKLQISLYDTYKSEMSMIKS